MLKTTPERAIEDQRGKEESQIRETTEREITGNKEGTAEWREREIYPLSRKFYSVYKMNLNWVGVDDCQRKENP